jgi:hypothetical protein
VYRSLAANGIFSLRGVLLARWEYSRVFRWISIFRRRVTCRYLSLNGEYNGIHISVNESSTFGDTWYIQDGMAYRTCIVGNIYRIATLTTNSKKSMVKISRWMWRSNLPRWKYIPFLSIF